MLLPPFCCTNSRNDFPAAGFNVCSNCLPASKLPISNKRSPTITFTAVSLRLVGFCTFTAHSLPCCETEAFSGRSSVLNQSSTNNKLVHTGTKTWALNEFPACSTCIFVSRELAAPYMSKNSGRMEEYVGSPTTGYRAFDDE